jgi:hypothetical protein
LPTIICDVANATQRLAGPEQKTARPGQANPPGNPISMAKSGGESNRDLMPPAKRVS